MKNCMTNEEVDCMTNEEVVRITSEKLCSNDDWRDAYERYAKAITSKKTQFDEAAKFLKKTFPYRKLGLLRIYFSIAQSQNPSIECDLRILGQSVGTLCVKKNKHGEFNLSLKISSEKAKHNKEYLNIETKANPPRKPYAWDSEEARKIWNVFVNFKGEDIKTHSNEHRLETLVLSDLAKGHISDGKVMTSIQPVMLGSIGFFQMRTPLSASNHKIADYPKYSMRENGAACGGGIDILARIVHKKEVGWRLVIIELKDQNKKSEPQPEVMQQALVYATFIAHLLRDKKCGNLWYNIFRDQKEDRFLDEKKELKIDVISMMPPIPYNKKGKPLYEEGEMNPIPVPGIPNVTLYPHTIYINADLQKFKIKNVYGTLIDDKKEW